jgi:hypothetical protein
MQTNRIQPMLAALCRTVVLIVCLGFTLTAFAPAVAAKTSGSGMPITFNNEPLQRTESVDENSVE